MDTFLRLLGACCAALVIDNTILVRALGVSTLLNIAKDKKQLMAFGVSMTGMTTVTCILAYFADKFLGKLPYSHLYTPIIYVIIISAVYVLELVLLWRFANKFFKRTRKFIHLSAFNCAVLGTLFLAPGPIQTGDAGLLSYIFFGLGAGLGFLLASMLLFAAYDRLYSTDMPDTFRGFPLVLLYLGVLSMVFYTLTGRI